MTPGTVSDSATGGSGTQNEESGSQGRRISRRRTFLGLLSGGAAVGTAGYLTGARERPPRVVEVGVPARPVTVRDSDVVVAGGKTVTTTLGRQGAVKAWPRRAEVHSCSASYLEVGDTSRTQYERIIRNLTMARPGYDVAVIDPQYLTDLVESDALMKLDGVGDAAPPAPDRARQACLVDETRYAIPLNVDVPLLVANLDLVDQGTWTLVKQTTDAREFWTKAYEAASASNAQVPMRLPVGACEGATACLVELMAAFGCTVYDDPGFTTATTAADAGTAIVALHDLLAGARGPLLGTGAEPIEEDDVYTDFAAGQVGIARMWPATLFKLRGPDPKRKVLSSDWVAIPRGTLGGQVCVVSARTRFPEASVSMVRHLCGEAAQISMLDLGRYLPACSDVYGFSQVTDWFPDLAAQVAGCSLRPSVRGYLEWSNRFQTVVAQAVASGKVGSTTFEPLSED